MKTITLTNAQLNAFNSPIFKALIGDKSRPFPVMDAFRLYEITTSLQDKLSTYNKTVSELLTRHNVEVLPTGEVVYKEEDVRELVNGELKKLNELEIDIPGEKLTISETWPNLTLQEISILRPLLNG